MLLSWDLAHELVVGYLDSPLPTDRTMGFAFHAAV
jgi:hypothetical protein